MCCGSFQERFKFILVDEYQDTNVAQYLWLKLLAQTTPVCHSRISRACSCTVAPQNGGEGPGDRRASRVQRLDEPTRRGSDTALTPAIAPAR